MQRARAMRTRFVAPTSEFPVRRFGQHSSPRARGAPAPHGEHCRARRTASSVSRLPDKARRRSAPGRDSRADTAGSRTRTSRGCFPVSGQDKIPPRQMSRYSYKLQPRNFNEARGFSQRRAGLADLRFTLREARCSLAQTANTVGRPEKRPAVFSHRRDLTAAEVAGGSSRAFEAECPARVGTRRPRSPSFPRRSSA
jgi:hypothetical protein